MKYAIKTQRIIQMGIINVWDVLSVPNTTNPYTMKYGRGVVETLRVFESEQKAKAAYRQELVASNLSKLPKMGQKSRFKDAVKYCYDNGISFQKLYTEVLKISEPCFNGYYRGANCPEPRLNAKMIIFTQMYKKLLKDIESVLPPSGSLGNNNKSRGGRPEIWKDAPQNKK